MQPGRQRPHSYCYTFSHFKLDPSTRTLSKNGQTIIVQAQVFDLLHYLARHPGEVVSKDQLLMQVWNNLHLSDAVITQAVKKARHALGDDGRKQALIRTVHGRGISFLPEVVQHEMDARVIQTQSSSQAQSQVQATKPRNMRVLLLFPIAILAALLIWLLAPGSAPDQPQADETLVVFPFDNASGEADLDWLQVGLAQTTALLLDQFSSVRVLAPQDFSDIPAGTKNQQMNVLGAGIGLEARVEKREGQFTLDWQLTVANDEAQSYAGEIISADSSQLARQLADAVLSYLSGQPNAPLPSQPLLQDPLAMELYGRAIQAMYGNRYDQAKSLLQAALAREPNAVPLRVAYAQASFDYSNAAQSIADINMLIEEVVDQDPAAAASLIKTIGIELWNSGEIEASATTLQRGLELLENSDAIGLRAAMLNALSLSLNSQSNTDAAWDAASQAELIFRELNDPYHLSLVLTNMAYFAEDQGRILQAGELHYQALEIRERYQFPELIAASKYGLARIQRRSGNFDQAEAWLNESLATMSELERGFDIFDNLEELSEVNMRQQKFAEAETRINQAATVALENDDALGQAWAKQVRGRIALRNNKSPVETLALVASARTALGDLGEQQDYFMAGLELANAYLRVEEGGDAARKKASEVLIELSADDAIHSPVLKLRYDAMHAEVLATEHRIDDAIVAYRDVVRQARQIGVIDLEAEYAIRLGQLALAANDVELARSMLAIASRWSPEYYRSRELASGLAGLN